MRCFRWQASMLTGCSSALIDMGCSRTIVDANWYQTWKRAVVDVMMIGDLSHPCCVVGVVTISMEEGGSAKINLLVVHSKPLVFNLLLGSMQWKHWETLLLGQQDQYRSATRESLRVLPFSSMKLTSPLPWTTTWKWSEDPATKSLHDGVLEYPEARGWAIANSYHTRKKNWGLPKG